MSETLILKRNALLTHQLHIVTLFVHSDIEAKCFARRVQDIGERQGVRKFLLSSYSTFETGNSENLHYNRENVVPGNENQPYYYKTRCYVHEITM